MNLKRVTANVVFWGSMGAVCLSIVVLATATAGWWVVPMMVWIGALAWATDYLSR